MAVNAGMNCSENRTELVEDFGSGCGQNFEGSTAARTRSRHESMHDTIAASVLPLSSKNAKK